MEPTTMYRIWFRSEAGRYHQVLTGWTATAKAGWAEIDHLHDLRREESNPQPGRYELWKVETTTSRVERDY